ncbi:MAG: hypothetical protein UY27_C0031G0006 [Candidatus Gottesmanbacteria bacterium GW2011_GWA1_48_13]|uniref:30S ribosomal protein S20 n=1 Tax=Candidatus Gottesmanbacteria bacterium GW2011_GWA1_48_13 TaxID=1618439 RepID=A0A0G1XKD2_9BACT|nr:MAG: hypothetical protein UY27_C0031G0006 [Candidatus Gottesmanbacteria bacterium GW2011_GWA1_48_13]
MGQAISGHDDESGGEDAVLFFEENIPHVCYYTAMPVTKGAIRKQRADRRRAAINLRVKKTFKEAVLAVRKHPGIKNLTAVYRRLDRAAKTHVIHKKKIKRQG